MLATNSQGLPETSDEPDKMGVCGFGLSQRAKDFLKKNVGIGEVLSVRDWQPGMSVLVAMPELVQYRNAVIAGNLPFDPLNTVVYLYCRGEARKLTPLQMCLFCDVLNQRRVQELASAFSRETLLMLETVIDMSPIFFREAADKVQTMGIAQIRWLVGGDWLSKHVPDALYRLGLDQVSSGGLAHAIARRLLYEAGFTTTYLRRKSSSALSAV